MSRRLHSSFRWNATLVAMALVVAAIAAVIAPNPVQAATVLGGSQVEASTDANPAGLAEAYRVSATSTATLASISVYVDSSSSATKLAAGLYADASGHPGALLASGSVTGPIAGAWTDVGVSSVSVTSGVTYWLAILSPSGAGTLAFRDRCCGGGTPTEVSASSSLAGLPATWSPGTRYADGPVSIYASTSPATTTTTSTTLPTTSTTTTVPTSGTAGQWGPLKTWPMVAMHSVLMRTGDLLFWDGWQQPTPTAVWRPSTDTFSAEVAAPTSIFCGGVVHLSDGRVMTIGGYGIPTTGDLGIVDTTAFDPATSRWSALANMHKARWYPTVTQLGDGRFVAISGNSANATTWADTPEVYDPNTNTWTLLSNVSTAQVHEVEYPFSYLIPSGKVFTIAPSADKSFTLDVANQAWTQVGGTSGLKNGSSVMYRPGKVLYSGGAADLAANDPARATTSVIDLTAATPAWQPVAPMTKARIYHTLTMLADGTVLSLGGNTNGDQVNPAGGVLPTEIWNPTTQSWTAAAPMAAARSYHHTAVLLPDATVLVAGGGHSVGLSEQSQYSGQIYSPPYLFKGARPVISSAPSATTYGSPMTIGTPQAASIASVNLVSLGADTHQIDMDQHFVPLSFSAGAGSLTVQTPSSSAIAPPGDYMVFVVNDAGVPSVASMVHVSGASDTTAPTVAVTTPAAGATVSGTVTVGATASDDTGVASVQFRLDGSPLGAPVSGAPYTASWNTATASNGSHTLTATATDGAGNARVSNPITVTVANSPGAGLALHQTVNARGRGTVTTPTFNAQAGELLVAFVGSDGTAGQTATVTGGGLSWTLAKRSNTQLGTSEVWVAKSTTAVSGVTVRSAQKTAGFDQSLTVVGFTGAAGLGATSAANATTGAPSAALVTTKPGSWVFGVGNDWDSAVARSLGAGQTMVNQWVDTAVGDTFWVQSRSTPTSASGTSVTINDTAPTGDRWNLTAVEVLAG